MKTRFPEYKTLDLSQVNKDILKIWDENDTFHKSVREVDGKGEFVFYEGPPSANGIPGIHHVMARTIKDAICRYVYLDRRGHVDDLVLDHLELHDRLLERDPAPGILDCLFQDYLGYRNAEHADNQPLKGEILHDRVESLAFAA